MQFIGRGNTIADPQSMNQGDLSGSQGSVLDPIVAIRYRIILNPQESTTIDMVFGMGETREASLGMIEKYQDRHLTDRAFELAWTHSQVVLRQINATESGCAALWALGQFQRSMPMVMLRADPAIPQSGISAANQVCGAIPSPAICPLYSYRSRTRRISIS